MKKQIIAIITVAVLTSAGLALAKTHDKGKDLMSSKGMGMMGDGDMMDKGGMMGDKMMGMCSMMQSMMQRQIVVTSDGGIIVVMGNKLTKYDRELNVVKEVELKMDMEGMQKMMENMKSMCPMMGKGMMGDKDTDSTTPVKEVDHASHH